jgi:hypothetical protein
MPATSRTSALTAGAAAAHAAALPAARSGGSESRSGLMNLLAGANTVLLLGLRLDLLHLLLGLAQLLARLLELLPRLAGLRAVFAILFGLGFDLSAILLLLFLQVANARLQPILSLELIADLKLVPGLEHITVLKLVAIANLILGLIARRFLGGSGPSDGREHQRQSRGCRQGAEKSLPES